MILIHYLFCGIFYEITINTKRYQKCYSLINKNENKI